VHIFNSFNFVVIKNVNQQQHRGELAV